MGNLVKATLLAGVLAMSLAAADSIYDFTLPSIDGTPKPLSALKGKVVLIVNVAAAAGTPPQYAGLEKLYEKYMDQGLVIIGVPANTSALRSPHQRGDQDVLHPQVQRLVPDAGQGLGEGRGHSRRCTNT